MKYSDSEVLSEFVEILLSACIADRVENWKDLLYSSNNFAQIMEIFRCLIIAKRHEFELEIPIHTSCFERDNRYCKSIFTYDFILDFITALDNMGLIEYEKIDEYTALITMTPVLASAFLKYEVKYYRTLFGE